MPKGPLLYPGVRRRPARLGRPVQSAARKAALARLAAQALPKFRRGAGRRGARVLKPKQNMRKTLATPSVGGLPSFSSWFAYNKPSKRVSTMKKVAAPNYWVSNQGLQISNSEGFQAATEFGYNTLAQLQAIMANVPGQNVSPRPSTFVVESVSAEFLMTNSSLATQYVDIYDIVRKRDMGNNTNTSAPVEAWQTGISDEIYATPDLTAFTNFNCLPTDARLFNDYFKIIKRTHIGLAAGATHRHHVGLKCNKLIDSEMLIRASGDLAGVACYTMVVINGQPCSIDASGGAVVTTAKTALDVVAAIRVKYTWVADNQVLWSFKDNLSSLTGEVITQPSLGAFVANTIA